MNELQLLFFTCGFYYNKIFNKWATASQYTVEIVATSMIHICNFLEWSLFDCFNHFFFFLSQFESTMLRLLGSNTAASEGEWFRDTQQYSPPPIMVMAYSFLSLALARAFLLNEEVQSRICVKIALSRSKHVMEQGCICRVFSSLSTLLWHFSIRPW